MENNGKGTSIFYGVIGVATLVITIIGATFAYFSATTNSAENAATATGATLELGFDDDNTGHKTNLIPIDVTQDGFNKGGFVGESANKCKDVNGNTICSLYEFTISNPSTSPAAQRIYGTIKASVNEFTNFKLAVFKGEASDVDASSIGWDVDGTAVTAYTTDYTDSTDPNTTYTKSADDATRKHVIGNKGDLVLSATSAAKDAVITVPAWEQVLDIGESMTYTIVMYIPETGSAQNGDQGKEFAAGVYFTTEGSGTGVTGILSATSQ